MGGAICMLSRRKPGDALDSFGLAHRAAARASNFRSTPTGPDRGLLMRLEPPVMRLEPAAKQVWIDFHDSPSKSSCVGSATSRRWRTSRARPRKTPSRDGCGLQALRSRSPRRAGRDGGTCSAGAAVAGWHLSEARRVFLDVDAPAEVQDARELAQWLVGRGREITDSSDVPIIDQAGMLAVREITRWGPNRVRDRTRRDDAIEKLEEAGHLRRSKRGREACVRINPKLWAVE
jgi:hypothetical protein